MKTEKDNFSDVATEDLIKKKKSTSFATGLLIGILVFLSMITIFQTINKRFTTLLIVPFAFLPILIIICSQLKAINKELLSRKLKQ